MLTKREDEFCSSRLAFRTRDLGRALGAAIGDWRKSTRLEAVEKKQNRAEEAGEIQRGL